MGSVSVSPDGTESIGNQHLGTTPKYRRCEVTNQTGSESLCRFDLTTSTGRRAEGLSFSRSLRMPSSSEYASGLENAAGGPRDPDTANVARRADTAKTWRALRRGQAARAGRPANKRRRRLIASCCVLFTIYPVLLHVLLGGSPYFYSYEY